MAILSENRIREILRTVDDPEIGINIVDLGFVHKIVSETGRIEIQLALTSQVCPMREAILNWIREAVRRETDQELHLDTDTAPPWTPEKIDPRLYETSEYDE